MTRRHLQFECEGAALVGTLDEAAAETALLMVTGGNELRAGAWNGQALMAARIAAAGFPVFRFDRRGVGDSEGANAGFRGSANDIAAAIAALKAEAPQVRRVIGFGNCDGASGLMLSGGAGFDGLVLSNPWTIEPEAEGEEPAPPPPAAVRAHYAQRLKDPRAILRLFKGGVAFGKLFASLRDALRPAPPPGTLAQELAAGLQRFKGPVTILLAERDRTAQAFEAGWDRNDARLRRCAGGTHSYVESQDWLAARLLEALRA
ncbi:hydrolase 1, exosortase A system-associated [Novosphingobium sp. TH158]|uniref:hydrolase 1, exosortase A system-associated n=1 Tax=Novosphingobium sp. TH158 TaxID=2067455 RepID=UPI000C799AD8|nr:hydrolase 1, exosortase A system-associated [Novosphingobium sp. TH158]PLK25765.1 hydrolase 1, exosortase A system-associated [Novosphingobium sp. TH158]